MLVLLSVERLTTEEKITTARIMAMSSKHGNRPNGVRRQFTKWRLICGDVEVICRHPGGARTTKHKPPSAFQHGVSPECAAHASGSCESCTRGFLRSRGCVCRPRSIRSLRARVGSRDAGVRNNGARSL